MLGLIYVTVVEFEREVLGTISDTVFPSRSMSIFNSGGDHRILIDIFKSFVVKRKTTMSPVTIVDVGALYSYLVVGFGKLARCHTVKWLPVSTLIFIECGAASSLWVHCSVCQSAMMWITSNLFMTFSMH